MKTESFYEQAIASPGSDLYYSLRTLDNEAREGILVLHALFREFHKAALIQEKSVVIAKLNWWQQELQTMFAGNPSHPITCSLKDIILDYSLPQGLFFEMLEGVQLTLEVDHCCTEEDFLLYCYRERGILEILCSYINAEKIEPSLVQYGHDLGVCLALCDLIINLRHYVKQGRVYFPLEELEKFEVDKSVFFEQKTTPELIALLQFQANRARAYYQKSLKKLPNKEHYVQRQGIILGKLLLAVLAEIEKEDFPVFSQQVQLTPLHKLWVSWRLLRQLKKLRFKHFL